MNPLKVVLLGNSAVGKTSIIHRFAYDRFDSSLPSTLGGMFVVRKISIPEKNIEIKFNIWDTAGQERYHSLAATYYKDADIAIIVYDITNMESFKRAKLWLNELQDIISNNSKLVLLANKSDLIDDEAVDPVIAKQYAIENNMKFSVVSAKTGNGIVELFTDLAIEFSKLEKNNDKHKGNTNLKINGDNKRKKENCC